MAKNTVLFLLLVSVFSMHQSFGQERKRKMKPQDLDKKFLQKQWWLGPRGGLNISSVSVGDRYTVYNSTTDPGTKQYDKTYKNFSIPGGQAGIEVTFVTHGFSISFQPNYRRQSFYYSTQSSWNDLTGSAALIIKNEVNNYLDYFEFPLFVKYDLLRGNWKPFVQLGAYYGIMTGASKSLKHYRTDVASGNTREYLAEEFTVGASDLYVASNYGLAGGLGISYDIGNIRLIFDATYRMGLNNITDKSERFSNDKLRGVGDAADDLKLNNITFSLGCLFPLRFLSSRYYEAAD